MSKKLVEDVNSKGTGVVHYSFMFNPLSSLQFAFTDSCGSLNSVVLL